MFHPDKFDAELVTKYVNINERHLASICLNVFVQTGVYGFPNDIQHTEIYKLNKFQPERYMIGAIPNRDVASYAIVVLNKVIGLLFSDTVPCLDMESFCNVFKIDYGDDLVILGKSDSVNAMVELRYMDGFVQRTQLILSPSDKYNAFIGKYLKSWKLPSSPTLFSDCLVKLWTLKEQASFIEETKEDYCFEEND